jgi:hypothetical protein
VAQAGTAWQCSHNQGVMLPLSSRLMACLARTNLRQLRLHKV